MFSIENFYQILRSNLFKPLNINCLYFYPFGSTDSNNLLNAKNHPLDLTKKIRWCNTFFYDQEPIFRDIVEKCIETGFKKIPGEGIFDAKIQILANSEFSQEKQFVCQTHNFNDWYYFYHGFAALDWYRDYQYFSNSQYDFTKVFISLNRLVTKDRSYRLLVVSEMIKHDLLDKGIVSCHLIDQGWGIWSDELNDENSKLTVTDKEFISEQIGKLSVSIIADVEVPRGSLSADAGFEELNLLQDAFWHIVTETIFYYPKLHLTEKTFKPIVARRPFMLVSAPGNLAYLKSYGFKTFDKWIDESYDNEPDNSLRIAMIIAELRKLCNLSPSDLRAMYEEMIPTLEYNFNHFYNEFKTIIVREMLQNFKEIIEQHNVKQSAVDVYNIPIDISIVDFLAIEKRLLQ